MENCCAEVFGDGLAHVGEGIAGAEVRAGTATGRIGEDGDVFAGVIGGGPASVWIAAVVGGDHQQIGRLQQGQEAPEQVIEFFERLRETFDVLAMAVEHVEIDQVAKDQAGLAVFCGGG